VNSSLSGRLIFGLAMAVVFGGVATAGPVTYTITFLDGGPPVPTSGEFTYDPAAGFSNFLVSWDGVTFDLTAAANAPDVTSPCAGESSSAATSFGLMSHTLCPGSVFSWSGFAIEGLGDFGFVSGGGGPNNQVVVELYNQPLSAFEVLDLEPGGDFTISALPDTTAAPEPSTACVPLLSVVLVAGVQGTLRRRKSRRVALRSLRMGTA
jgi:hypothetical protein